MRTRLAAVAGALALAPALLQSQIGRAGAELARPTAWAITGARIVPVSGPVIPQGTIVVRDGIIVAVGPADRTPAPADAHAVIAHRRHSEPDEHYFRRAVGTHNRISHGNAKQLRPAQPPHAPPPDFNAREPLCFLGENLA